MVTNSSSEQYEHEVELERVRPQAGPAGHEVQGRVRVQGQPVCQEQLQPTWY